MHATSPRAGRKLTDAECAAFLDALARTGNFALSCQMIGRVKSGLYKRRARDPVFAALCVAALATFSARKGRRAPSGASIANDGAGGARTSPGALRYLPAKGARPAQFRHVPAGSLTAAGEADFLAAFAATGNVRLAADSVGVAPSTIHRRRHADADFARRFDEAAETARAALESLFMERVNRTFDPDYRRAATGSPALAEQDRVTTTQALQMLHWLDRKGRR